MADEQASASSKKPSLLLLETNLRTKLGVLITPQTTVGDLKKQVETEHRITFPHMGEIVVRAIQVHSAHSFYFLSDTMLVWNACKWSDEYPCLHVDANQPNNPEANKNTGTSLSIEHNVQHKTDVISQNEPHAPDPITKHASNVDTKEDIVIDTSTEKSGGGETIHIDIVENSMSKEEKGKGTFEAGCSSIEKKMPKRKKGKGLGNDSEMQDDKSVAPAKQKKRKKKKEKTSVKTDPCPEHILEDKTGNAEDKFKICAKLMPALPLSLHETESAYAAVAEIGNISLPLSENVSAKMTAATLAGEHISKIQIDNKESTPNVNKITVKTSTDPQESKRHHTVLEENTNIQATGQEFADPGTCIEDMSKVPTNRSTKKKKKTVKTSKKSKKQKSAETKSPVSLPQIPIEVEHGDVHQNEVDGTITKDNPKATYKKKRQSDPEATVTEKITALPQNVTFGIDGTGKQRRNKEAQSGKSDDKKGQRNVEVSGLFSDCESPNILRGDKNVKSHNSKRKASKTKDPTSFVGKVADPPAKKVNNAPLVASIPDIREQREQTNTDKIFKNDSSERSEEKREVDNKKLSSKNKCAADITSSKLKGNLGAHASLTKNTSVDVGGGAVGPQNEDVDINVNDTSRPSGSSEREWSIHPCIDPSLVKDNSRRAKSSDPGWNYARWPNIGDRYSVQCLLCGHISKGGIKRFKNHLIGGFCDVIKCPYTTKAIMEQMLRWNQDRQKK